MNSETAQLTSLINQMIEKVSAQRLGEELNCNVHSAIQLKRAGNCQVNSAHFLNFIEKALEINGVVLVKLDELHSLKRNHKIHV